MSRFTLSCLTPDDFTCQLSGGGGNFRRFYSSVGSGGGGGAPRVFELWMG